MSTAWRLLSWNVRDLLGDPLAVARVIASAGADLVCLQEAPRWPGSRWRLAALARACGLVLVEGGRNAAGAALLASLRVDVDDVQARRLPVPGRLTRPRGFVRARVRAVGSGPAAVVATVHLSLDPAERLRHAGLIRQDLAGIARDGDGVIVAGDLNEPPGGPAWSAFGPLADALPEGAPTFPVRAPARRIDAVLVAPSGPVAVRAVTGWAPPPSDLLIASDHVPVLVTVSAREPDRARS